MQYKILMSNLGYLRGINGRLAQHVLYAHRHFYCPVGVQQKVLRELLALLTREDPDLCCFVEIDRGSGNAGSFNQLEALVGEKYPYFDVESKYGESSRLRSLAFTRGKSNAFLSKHQLPFEKIYFQHGVKRLIYKIALKGGVTIFFAHFSLQKETRARQLAQVRELLKNTPGESILLGDFNILDGFTELAPLLHENNLVLLNQEGSPTFTFHRFEKALDLCLCTPGLAERLQLTILPQPFSDHAALLVTLSAA